MTVCVSLCRWEEKALVYAAATLIKNVWILLVGGSSVCVSGHMYTYGCF